MKTLKSVFICILIISVYACSKEDDNSQQQEGSELIDNFLDADIINALNTLGFNFRTGSETPNIAGDFKFDPLLLISNTTNITYENEVNYINGSIYKISNLNAENRKFNFQITDLVGNPSFTLTSDTFYYGEGNSFCAFVKLLPYEQSEEPYLLLAISGVVSEDGIINAEQAYVNLTDREEFGFESLRGQGQLARDDDNLAERQ
ncbi:hypothetical protein [Psychroserpens sp.]|uniref:hypothetical protein n=1 Tax=Psychroserpens sp. TaxID=2020870 RepID=UPI00385B0F5D